MSVMEVVPGQFISGPKMVIPHSSIFLVSVLEYCFDIKGESITLHNSAYLCLNQGYSKGKAWR